MTIDQVAEEMKYDIMYSNAYQNYIKHLTNPTVTKNTKKSLVEFLKRDLTYGKRKGLDEHIDSLLQILFENKFTLKLKHLNNEGYEKTFQVNPERKQSLIEYQILKIYSLKYEDYKSAVHFRNKQASHIVNEHSLISR